MMKTAQVKNLNESTLNWAVAFAKFISDNTIGRPLKVDHLKASMHIAKQPVIPKAATE